MPYTPDLSGCALDDRYELHAVIGEGAFGRVYAGRDRRLARSVAVKVIKPWWTEDPEWVATFEQEAQLLARVRELQPLLAAYPSRYLGVVCLILKLRRTLTPYYSINICDPTPITTVVETSHVVALTLSPTQSPSHSATSFSLCAGSFTSNVRR